jgi:uncharacterized protein (TIGR03067 family)
MNRLVKMAIIAVSGAVLLILAGGRYARHCESELLAARSGDIRAVHARPSVLRMVFWRRCLIRWLDGSDSELRIYALRLLQLLPYDATLYGKLRPWIDSDDQHLRSQVVRYISRANGKTELLLFAELWNREVLTAMAFAEDLIMALCRNPNLQHLQVALKAPDPVAPNVSRSADASLRRLGWPLVECFQSRDSETEEQLLKSIADGKTEGIVYFYRRLLLGIGCEYSEKLWTLIESRFPSEARAARVDIIADPFMFRNASQGQAGWRVPADGNVAWRSVIDLSHLKSRSLEVSMHTAVTGDWWVFFAEMGGRRLVPVSKMRWQFSDAEAIYWSQEGVECKYTYNIDASRYPATIDLTVAIGDQMGRTLLGIYSKEDDELTLCVRDLDSRKQTRPESFETPLGSDCGLMLLQRAGSGRE